jgi:molybdopterin/thiamine biosynthesis adenylyltransferase/rhodanese-related sulfurtransferase
MNTFLPRDEIARYSQQIKLNEVGVSGQTKLKCARVLCVGLGGLGSPVSLYLAAAGVGTLGIIDDDIVELSNLQRQILYRTTQVAHLKIMAAKEQLLGLNPTIQVNAYSEKLTEQNARELLSQYDIIADCSDNFYTRYLLHDLCFTLGKPYVYAGVFQFQGYCSIFNANKGPCLHCLFPFPKDSKFIPNCDSSGVLGVVPGVLGVLQATEIIKWILQLGVPLQKRLLVVDLLNMSFKEIHFSQNPDCTFCVHYRPGEFLLAPPPCQRKNDLKNYAITAEAMREFLQQNKEAILIDVRTKKEHKTYNIGGKLLPLAELPNRLSELNPNYPIILYCYSGKRSIQALTILLEAGFTSVKYLLNGIEIY